ncbi:MAG TPA: tripartite tricarboxylate transporter substrate binding protein [Burkholderiales bacterium]|nr:tripartite tricarboxylate transporter substrate binding protein [Burkholderiales bacterium]
MQMPLCRTLLVRAILGGGLMLSHLTLSQGAETYPTKPVRFVCVTAPGGGLDVVGRIVADRLSRSLAQTVIVENRPGAGGNIASEYVARGSNDGYTLLETTTNHNLNAFIYKNPGYDPRKDFVGVVQLTEAPSVIVVNAQSPYRSLKELLVAVRAAPGKIVYGHGGNGQPTHVAMEALKSAAKVDIPAVPYKGGGPATQDLLANQIPLAMSALPGMSQHLQSGALRALAVTSEKRWPVLPDVPSVAESGFPGYSHMTWIGLLAPTGTPRHVIARMNQEAAKVLTMPEVRQRIMVIGAEPVGKSPEHFEAMLKADYEATQKLVAQIGLKVD